MIDFEKLVSLNYVRDIREICAPLFKAFQINYYDYARFYQDGRCVILFSNPDWVKTFLNKDYVPPVQVIPTGLNPWHSYINLDLLSVARQEFKHDKGVTYFKRTAEYDEIINIATHKNNPHLENFCVNHEDFLNQFSNYFQDKASPIIQQMEKEAIYLKPPTPIEVVSYEDQFKTFFDLIDQDQEAKTHFSKSLLQHNHPKLTPKEQECLYFFKQGMSAKKIAQYMNISHRTVEKHIHHLKTKFNCKSSLALLNIIQQTAF